MKESVEIKETFNTKPSAIYNAWLNSKEHGDMTGGEANCSDEVGGEFSAWDEYIQGSNKSLTANEEIIQNWRTLEFEESDEDSELTIRLKEVDGGCELTLLHTNIPEGQTQYKDGWVENYIEPMKAYFNN
jgi:activator of HSP90 ATPase